MYAYATIKPTDNGKVVFHAVDKGERFEYPATTTLPMDGNLDLLKGIYNRIVQDFAVTSLSFELTTFVGCLGFGFGIFINLSGGGNWRICGMVETAISEI